MGCWRGGAALAPMTTAAHCILRRLRCLGGLLFYGLKALRAPERLDLRLRRILLHNLTLGGTVFKDRHVLKIIDANV